MIFAVCKNAGVLYLARAFQRILIFATVYRNLSSTRTESFISVRIEVIRESVSRIVVAVSVIVGKTEVGSTSVNRTRGMYVYT